MSELRLSRRQLLGVGTAGTLGVLVAPQGVLAHENEVSRLRWDMVVNGVNGWIVPGTSVDALDFTALQTIDVSGSGVANPEPGTASGGGTFVRRDATNGSFLDAGVYIVTGFNSFLNGGGSLAGSSLTDTVGKLRQTTGGVLSLNVSAFGLNAPFTAVLEIISSLPGTSPAVPAGLGGGGIRFVVAQLGLDFQPPERGGGILFGSPLFHILED